ncbi:MAG TPA: DoxX family protein [Stellaceae bacterium]|nr:DoxX family protein [Stellaceae bacterium]
MDGTTPLVWPQLGLLYHAAAPVAEALTRVVLGLALVPHGLRFVFGLFPNSGSRALSLAALGAGLDAHGYRPGWFWALTIAALELAGGPLLALGVFTRPLALAAFIFLVMAAIEHWRFDGYFWNVTGLEYPMVWSAGMLFFVVHGGGPYSLDSWLLGYEF